MGIFDWLSKKKVVTENETPSGFDYNSMNGWGNKVVKTNETPSEIIKNLLEKIECPVYMPLFETSEIAQRFVNDLPYYGRNGTHAYIIGGIVKDGINCYQVVTGGKITSEEALYVLNLIQEKYKGIQKGCMVIPK